MEKIISNIKQDVLMDVVIPSGNEKELIDMALTLGYRQIVFLTSNPRYAPPKFEDMFNDTDTGKKILIRTGYLLKDISELNKIRHRFDYIFARAERQFFEQKIDFIINSELSIIKDSFHYRSTSLNQVHAELAKHNGITIVFGFNNLLMSPVSVYGKMSQNAVLVNKYDLKSVSFSMATMPSMMRSGNILNALLTVLSL